MKQYNFLFSKIYYEDGHVCNHSVFLSVNLTKGAGDAQACRFPCLVPMSRTDQSKGNGCKQLQYKLRLTIKKSFVAERIAEPGNRLPGRKIACCRCYCSRSLRTA